MSTSTEHRDPSPPACTSSAPSTTAQSPHEQYTVIVRGIPFHLSRSQVEFDSPNYFTAAFLEHDFAEAQSRTLHLDRNPKLFAYIVEHLSGYSILPLCPRGLPETMSVEQATRNLRADAEYFDLRKLQQALRLQPGMSSDFPSAELDACHEKYRSLAAWHNMTPGAALGVMQLALQLRAYSRA